MLNYEWMKYAPSSRVSFDFSAVSPDRVIPYGDYFLSSCTLGDYDYYKTNTGHFKKLHNSKAIISILEKEFLKAYAVRETFVFCPRLGSPQAGLTRESKRTFSKENKIVLDIQEKYKNGVLW